MAMLMSILWMVGIALGSAWLVKRLPVLKDISNWVVFAFLFGIFLALPQIALTQVSDLVAMIPMLNYILAIPIGVFVGSWIGKYLPF